MFSWLFGCSDKWASLCSFTKCPEVYCFSTISKINWKRLVNFCCFLSIWFHDIGQVHNRERRSFFLLFLSYVFCVFLSFFHLVVCGFFLFHHFTLFETQLTRRTYKRSNKKWKSKRRHIVFTIADQSASWLWSKTSDILWAKSMEFRTGEKITHKEKNWLDSSTTMNYFCRQLTSGMIASSKVGFKFQKQWFMSQH